MYVCSAGSHTYQQEALIFCVVHSFLSFGSVCTHILHTLHPYVRTCGVCVCARACVCVCACVLERSLIVVLQSVACVDVRALFLRAHAGIGMSSFTTAD